MPSQELPSTEWERWLSYLQESFGLSLDDTAVNRFRIYLEELEHWNASMNLVSVRSTAEILWRHFADSLAVIKVIDEIAPGLGRRAAVIDIGTGAGFPGLPVKIARPEMRLTLVESVLKKCSFVEHVTERLLLGDVRIFNDRAETLAQEKAHRASYDFALSRALAKFSPNLEFTLPFVRTGGFAFIFKTAAFADSAQEMEAAQRPLSLLGGTGPEVFRYRIPSIEQEYGILAFRKSAATPPQYPRRAGVPEKKPL